MAPNLRKAALTAHVTASVGWVGAVAGFLALAIAGLTSASAEMASAAYLAMNTLYLGVIVPFALAALITGVVSSLGTEWGLFKHYWVVAKTLAMIPLTLLLLVHVQPVAYVAAAARNGTISSADLGGLKIQLSVYAGAALLALLVATALSVFKPRGRLRRR